MVHDLHIELELPVPRQRVFEFFADAGNLERITPPELGFRILTARPIEMRRGALIDYELKLFFVPFSWRTEIRDWEPPHRFVDVQLKGPYREWIHTHEFHETRGGTMIRDHVRYQLPLTPLGDVALPIVRRQLARIFRYRTEATRKWLTT